MKKPKGIIKQLFDDPSHNEFTNNGIIFYKYPDMRIRTFNDTGVKKYVLKILDPRIYEIKIYSGIHNYKMSITRIFYVDKRPEQSVGARFSSMSISTYFEQVKIITRPRLMPRSINEVIKPLTLEDYIKYDINDETLKVVLSEEQYNQYQTNKLIERLS